MAAAAAAAAATAATTGRRGEARRRLVALRREDGELLLHLRARAVRAGGRLAVPDELLEMRLALHADVLVDRHTRSVDIHAVDLKPRLEGRIVTLEPLEGRHAPGLREAAADERIWTWMITTDVEEWIRRALAATDMFHFAVLREGVVVGSTSYLNVVPEHRR